jgi:DNA-binding MarR family transcriptional regulator
MNDPETIQAVLDWSTIFLRQSMHDFNRFARNYGFSFVQMNVLMHLYYRGPREVMAFGDLMQVSPAGASQMVERLVQGGLVQRVASPEDRRVRWVHLTERGREAVEESIRARQAWVEQLVDTLGPEQRAAVGKALRVLTEQAGLLESETERVAENP